MKRYKEFINESLNENDFEIDISNIELIFKDENGNLLEAEDFDIYISDDIEDHVRRRGVERLGLNTRKEVKDFCEFILGKAFKELNKPKIWKKFIRDNEKYVDVTVDIHLGNYYFKLVLTPKNLDKDVIQYNEKKFLDARTLIVSRKNNILSTRQEREVMMKSNVAYSYDDSIVDIDFGKKVEVQANAYITANGEEVIRVNGNKEFEKYYY